MCPYGPTVSQDYCQWKVYAYPYGTCGFLGIVGLVSSVLAAWLLLTVDVLRQRSSNYAMIMLLMTACMARGFNSLFTHSISPYIFDEIALESCAYKALQHKVISSYQVEVITLMGIERYVSAKYYKLGLKVGRRHIILFAFCCWIFPLFYALTPLFGFGAYLTNWDDIGTHEDSRQMWSMWLLRVPSCDTIFYKVTFSILLLMQSVKAVVLTTYMFYWTYKIEKECYTGESSMEKKEKALTKSCSWVSLIFALCWMPTFIGYMWTIIKPSPTCPPENPPASLVMWGALGLEIAPIAIVITVFATNEVVRRTLLLNLFHRKQIREKSE